MQSVGQPSAPSSSASSSSSATSSAPAPATASCSSAAGAAASPPVAKGGLWIEFDSQVFASQQHRTSGTDSLIEMRRYVEERPISQDQDPLLWWKNKARSHLWANLQKKHLGVVATSVPAERIFSTAGQLISHRRCAIKAKNVHMILFLNKNL